MLNEIHKGKRITFTNTGSAISSGDLVAVGERCGVAMVDIAATSGTGTVSMEGTFELDKDGDEAFTQGDKLFRDASDNTVTKTATGGNKWVGYAESDATETSIVCRVTLSPLPNRAVNVAAEATADGSDAATTQALANALKTKVNAILTALKNAGIMLDS